MKKTPSPVRERLFTRDFILIMSATTCLSFMNLLFASSTALHVMALGGLQLQAGLLVTVGSMAALAIRPVSGILSDKYGRVKLLIASAVVSGICCASYGFAGALSMMVVIRGFLGLGFGTHTTCAGAVAADVLPKSRMSEGIAYYGIGVNIAQALAPIVAISIIRDGELSNFRQLFLFTSGLCVLGLVADCFIRYERERPAGREGSGDEGQVSGVRSQVSGDGGCEGAGDEGLGLRAKGLGLRGRELGNGAPGAESEGRHRTLFGFEHVVFAPMAVMVLMCIGYSSLNTFIIPYAREIGVANPGYFHLASASGMFVSRFIIGRVSDKYGSDVVIIPGFVVIAALLASLSYVGSLQGLLLIAFPMGFAQGAVTPTFNALLFKRSSPARRGSASGAAWSSIDIGFAIGTPLLGALADALDYRYVFWAAAAFMALALGLYVLIASDRVYHKK